MGFTKLCDRCFREVEYDFGERIKSFNYDNTEFKFLEKYYVCKECGREFYEDLHDYNIHAGNDELRKHYGIITQAEINELLNKYSLLELSDISGVSVGSLIWYKNGRTPSMKNSDLLKIVLYK